MADLIYKKRHLTSFQIIILGFAGVILVLCSLFQTIFSLFYLSTDLDKFQYCDFVAEVIQLI